MSANIIASMNSKNLELAAASVEESKQEESKVPVSQEKERID